MTGAMRSLTLLVVALAAPAPGQAAASSCDATARPGDGSVQRLVDGLRPGQTGCLAPGVHAGDVVIRTDRLTLRAQRPRTATLRGQLRIADGADGVTVRDLRLDGTNAARRPSPLVNGDDARFEGNDVTSRVDSCFVLGDKVWGVAERTVIAGNDIHHCGVRGTNQDHGVYVRQAVGTRIEDNVIRDNPDRGVQLFPNADGSRVVGNVIDRNGEGLIFSGDSADTSDGNVVAENLITRSRLRWDVESYWMRGRVGRGNELRENCIRGGARGAVQRPVGFTASSNAGRGSRCRLPRPALVPFH